MVNKFIGEVDASEFGEGFTIRLDMDGQGRLETDHGEFDFAGRIQLGLAVLSAKYIRSFLAVSLRDAGGVLVKDYELPNVPVEVIGRKCLDAFSLFRYGLDHEAWAKKAEALKGEATANPTKGTKA